MAVSLFPLNLSCDKKQTSPAQAYHKAVQTILTEIVRHESDNLRDTANILADTVIAKKRCFLYSGFPSPAGYYTLNSPGLPPVFINLLSKQMADTIRKGDTLIITESGDIPEFARKQDAHVIGLSSPQFIDEYPSSIHKVYAEKRRLGDAAEVIIKSHVPYWDGLVECPEYPFMILPGSGFVRTVILTALAGEVYYRSGGIGLTGNIPPHVALGYIEAVSERMKQITGQYETLQQSGKTITDTMIKGGRFFVYDSNNALKSELTELSGRPVFARYITREEILDDKLKADDALLFVSLRSNATLDLTLMNKVLSTVKTVISICPHDNTGGYRLFKQASFALDNLSPEKEGVITFDNGSKRYLHTGGPLNILLLWMLIGEITGQMIQHGKTPQYLMGSYFTESEQHNRKALEVAEKRGY